MVSGNICAVLKRRLAPLLIVTFAIAAFGRFGTPAATALDKAPPAHQAKLPTPESGNYKQFCTEHWTERGVLDSRMYNYCMTELAEADGKLNDLVTKYSSFPWMQAVVDAAIEHWTKRGMRNEEMVAYQVSRQVDAYLDIKYASEHKGYQRNALAQCEAKWWSSNAPDWEMTLFCYKQATGTD